MRRQVVFVKRHKLLGDVSKKELLFSPWKDNWTKIKPIIRTFPEQRFREPTDGVDFISGRVRVSGSVSWRCCKFNHILIIIIFTWMADEDHGSVNQRWPLGSNTTNPGNMVWIPPNSPTVGELFSQIRGRGIKWDKYLNVCKTTILWGWRASSSVDLKVYTSKQRREETEDRWQQ